VQDVSPLNACLFESSRRWSPLKFICNDAPIPPKGFAQGLTMTFAATGFKAKRITTSYEQTIYADPVQVFELICPVREAEWLDGWDYRLIFSESGFAEEGCVFISRQPGENDTIWLITKRDIEKREIEFVRVTPESRIARLVVAVKQKETNVSRVQITYTFTALCQEGNRILAELTKEKFSETMKFWETSMNYYLQTGKKLKRT
jgi:hypothetical protein